MVDDIFYSMSADDFRDAGLDVPDLSRFEEREPKWVTVNLPEDLQEPGDVRERSLTRDLPLRTLSERYVPFSTAHLDLARTAPLDVRNEWDVESKALPERERSHGEPPEDHAFFQLGTRCEYVSIGIRRSDKQTLSMSGIPVPH